MVQLRWYKSHDSEKLQYRQMIDKTMRAGVPIVEYGAPWGQMPPVNQNWEWSKWTDIPEVWDFEAEE